MYRSVDLRTTCCTIRKVEPLKRKLATLDAWIAGLRREQWVSRRNIAKVELDREHGGIVKLNPLADWTLDEVWDYVRDERGARTTSSSTTATRRSGARRAPAP